MSIAALSPACARGRRLNVFNWSDYIAPELVVEFEAQAACVVVYDNYSSDAELETKLISAGGGYDVAFPSDRAMAALLAKKVVGEIDLAKLPNVKYIDPTFLKPRFDPTNRFSVPYFWGTLALGLRTDHVTEPVASFAPLFDPRYRGKITMLDDAESVVAGTLAYLGLPLNSTADGDLARVKELLVKQRPLVEAYTSDAYKERLIGGEAWAALGWNGDLRQATDENPQIRAVVPEQGTMIWMDNMVVPRNAPSADLAHAFINFLLDPQVAARNAEYIHFATPNQAALALLPQDLQDDRSVYPPAEVIARCQWLEDRGPAIVKIEQLWREVRAG
jgi:spermidine/putrescine-binding protein